ncbi:glutathione S-transferase family protein [Shewanella sp. SNU WT4]|uniref:glutathione S-transferase family protein n=1 Tax=Shewanella sp. SNU WT4 TaxID=2590015 RepID=UPI001128827C|nr:glutathione S-transferase family protein [Shewanella sp. SNU WT4]QDF65344.1 glutathione S-transferase family protein [Shewanella sp. SNU WT4]
MDLYYHPLSRYSQKVLIALYEKQANFYPRIIELSDPLARQDYRKLSPTGKLPLLRYQHNQLYPESTIIIEFLDNTFPNNTQLLLREQPNNLATRLWDRLVDFELNEGLCLYDKHSNTNNQLEQQAQLRNIRLFLLRLEQQLTTHYWLCGDSLSLADCALIPCIHHPLILNEIRDLEHLSRYRQQSLVRGAWMLVSDEIEQARSAHAAGLAIPPLN